MTTNPNDYLTYPVLQAGMSHPSVKVVKALLRSQGGWLGTDSSDFGPRLKAAVQYFQGTHIGPDGVFLKGDGEVGPRTWWALYNASGAAQRNNLVVPVETTPGIFGRYADLPQSRQAFLAALFGEYKLGVHEVPDGSNHGDGVDKYIEGFGPVYWCALFQSWCWKQATGSYPHGHREAGVQVWWNKAVEGGYGYKKGSGYKPIPGDLAAFVYAAGEGHITAVVAVNENNSQFNTIGGNESNRVKLGLRTVLNEPKMVGWINLHGDKSDAFKRGLLSAEEIKTGDSTR